MSAAATCPACGAGLDPRQEYCLDCGARATSPRRPLHWLWPAAAAAVVAAAGAYAAIAVTGSSDGTSTIVALTPLTPAPEERPTTEGSGTPAETLRRWPARNGFTIVVAAVPVATGPAAAKANARRALAAGLPDVGILESARYSSLHPGYSIVFSGIYATRDEALAALPRVARRFRAAYVQEISR